MGVDSRSISVYKKTLEFIRANKNIIVSLLLIILIPASFLLHTLFFLKKFERYNTFFYGKRSQDTLNLVKELIKARMDDKPALNELLGEIIYLNPDIQFINLIEKNADESYKVISSTNKEEVNKKITSPNFTEQFDLVLSLKRGFIRTYRLYDESDKEFKSYILASENFSGNQLLNVLMDLEPLKIESNKIILRTYIILIVLLLLVMLLVLNHTELFGYVTLARRLKKLDDSKNEFISVASHELRSPVSSIKGYVDLFKTGVFGKLTQDQLEAFNKIEKITDNLSDLVEDLLQVSRIESEKISLDKKEIDPVEIFKSVFDANKAKALYKNLAINFTATADKYPKILADKEKLIEVLTNLVSNAIKYTFKGKVDLILDYHKTNKEIWFKVKDTGVGIDPEGQAFLFTKFFRIRNEATRNISGTGLGLWITKNLVELMGGKIYFQSLKGVGSEFSVVFKAVY